MQISLRMKLLLATAVAVTAYAVMGSNDEQTVDAIKSGATITHPGRSVTTAPHRLDAGHLLHILNQRVSKGSAADALFAAHSWYTPPPPAPPPPAAPQLTPAQEAALRAPVAPPLPFTYMGSYVHAGAEPVYFLTKGDRVYDVKVGDILDGTYSVDSSSNGQLVLTYKPLQIQQQLTIGSAQ